MSTATLTTKFVQNTQPQSKRVWTNDAKLPGLQLLVHPSGSKIYVVYRRVDGVPRRFRLGNALDITPQDARELAAQVLRELALGGNPIEDHRQKRTEATLSNIWDRWLEHAKLRKKTWEEDQRQWRTMLKPVFGVKCLSAVTPEDVRNWHSQLGRDRGPYTANRALALLSAMFTFAIRRHGFSGPNPAVAVERFKERSRERFLAPDELARFFKALEDEAEYVRDFFMLLLFTGARKSNVLQMRFSEITGDI